MNHFPTLQAMLPQVKIAQDLFDLSYRNIPTAEGLVEAAQPLNLALQAAIEAFYQDTAGANSRSTLMSVYLPIPTGSFTHGNLSYECLVRACETGRAP
jgi:hypothetical protein